MILRRSEQIDQAILTTPSDWKGVTAQFGISKSHFYRRAKELGVCYPQGKYPPEFYEASDADQRSRRRTDRYHTDAEYRARVIKRSTNWAQQNREKYMLRSVRCRAKAMNVPFDLKTADIVIPERCPVLGIPLVWGRGGLSGPSPASPSVDRIKPELGYTSGNIQIVSWRANNLKRDATVEELERVLAWMRSQES